MTVSKDVLLLVDEVCAAFEEGGIGEDYVVEAVRVVRALVDGKQIILDRNGLYAQALRNKFPEDHRIWTCISFADSEFCIRVAPPVDEK